MKMLEVCYKVGVRVVTVYAFSIENFKRSKFEVEALMDMAKVKLTLLAQHGQLLEKYGARMQFLGQRELIRDDVLEQMDKAIALTEKNNRAILNICAPYTSRDEITTAVRRTVIEYNEPLRPPLKRPFSESRIARRIRAAHLDTVSESEEDVRQKAESQDAEVPRIDVSDPEDAVEYEVNYNPLDPESRANLNRMTTIVARNLGSMAEGQTSKDADSLTRGATDRILDILKDPTLGEEDQLGCISDIIDTDIDASDYAELAQLASKLTDYSPPPDAEAAASNASGSTTLNQPSTNGVSSALPTNFRDPETITAEILTAHTFTGSSTPPLDLLIRTSGVERLSDFMLWQCHQDTDIRFIPCMWPEFDLWQFLPVLLEWQWRQTKEIIGDRRGARRKLGQ